MISALHDAASKVLEEKDAHSSVAATLIKFVGKGHGTNSVANNALRIGVWGSVLPSSSKALVDSVIRFEDALAAAVKTKVQIVNQLYTEFAIRGHREQQRGFVSTKPVAVSDYTVMQQGCRRWLDYCSQPEKTALRETLEAIGFPTQLTKHHGVLYPARLTAFSTGARKRGLYGPVHVYAQFARAAPWVTLLEYFCEVGVVTDNARGAYRLVLRVDMKEEAVCLLRGWRLQPETNEWLGICD